MYIMMVFNPIFLNLEISFKSDIPFTNEAIIKGTAINFNNFTKMVPNGFIQFPTKPAPPSVKVIPTPNNIPRIIPIKICQCNANFLI